MTPAQVQWVPLEYPWGSAIPAWKSSLPWPVRPIMNPWWHDPNLRHIRSESVAQLVIQEHLNHIYHLVTSQRENYDKINLWYPNRWTNSISNEIGRLSSGVLYQIKYVTETIFIVPKHQVPAGMKVTYANAVCDNRPLKYDPYCVRLTVGGDRLIYPGDTSTPDASPLDSKLMFNITITTPGDRFFCTYIKIIFWTI